MLVRDRPVDTPTVARLRGPSAEAARSGSAQRGVYLFLLTETDGHRLRQAGISSSGVLAFAVIKAAVLAAKTDDWVTIRRRAEEAIGRDYRWWYEATRKLEEAGFIECQRQRGRKPRYRLVINPHARSRQAA